MRQKNFNEMANRLYLGYIEDYPECGRGEYLAADTNRLLAFADFIATAAVAQVQAYLPELKVREWPALRAYIDRGIDHYLYENAKILALG